MSVSLRYKATAIAVTAFLSCSVVAAQQKPTIFVYGDSNTFGWVYEPKTQVVSRLPVDETWPYFMNRELGNKYHLDGVPDAPDGHKSYCTDHAARKRTTYLFKHFRSGANHTPTTLQCLSTWFSTSQPVSVTMTRSSTRTPNLPGRYTPGSMEKIMPGFTVSVLAALTSPFS